MNDKLKDKILQAIIKDKGGSREQYEMLLNKIANHESAGTFDPSIHQIGGGPGRGKYQFEGSGGSNRIYSSAVRTSNYLEKLGISIPKEIQSIIDEGTGDASKLSSTMQDVLVLGDLRMKGGIDLKDYVNGKTTIKDIWVDHWWAGWQKDNDLSKRKEAIQKFKNSNRSFENNFYKNKFRKEQQNQTQDINHQFNKVKDNIPSVPKINSNVDYKRYDDFQNSNFEMKNLATNNKQKDPLDLPRVDLTSMINDKFKNSNQMAKGGYTNLGKHDKNLNSFNTGGLHEQNPLGGIPLGEGNNGKPNTVEQKETSVNLKNGKFIFSHRLKI